MTSVGKYWWSTNVWRIVPGKTLYVHIWRNPAACVILRYQNHICGFMELSSTSIVSNLLSTLIVNFATFDRQGHRISGWRSSLYSQSMIRAASLESVAHVWLTLYDSRLWDGEQCSKQMGQVGRLRHASSESATRTQQIWALQTMLKPMRRICRRAFTFV